MKHAILSTAGLVVFGTMLGACAPTFAPPASSLHYGAPGRLRPHEGEVGASAGMYSAGVHAAIPVAANTRVEVGAEADYGALTGSQPAGWAQGRAGVRHAYRHGHLTLDIEGGVAAGAGGANGMNHNCNIRIDDPTGCGPQTGADRMNWYERPSGGAYVGGAVGVRFLDAIEPFFRVRGQVTGAANVPVTTWGSALLGIDFRLGPLDVWLGGGMAMYRNARDGEYGPLAEGGISVPFEVGRRSTAR